jgi:predicted short-subunit dehydrogenase-like oxidoreductase (DUF2520 family)
MLLILLRRNQSIAGIGNCMKVTEMKIGFIGAGCVGTSFGIYLKQRGFDLRGYYSRTAESAEKAARLSGSRCYPDQRTLLDDIDILFITTNDTQIQVICDSLAKNGFLRRDQLIVHMSGALSSRILQSAKEKGCCTYSLHPLQSFADKAKAFSSLPETVFSLEGDMERRSILEDMLVRLGNPHFSIDAEQKALYHAATCICSNFLTALIEEALQFFTAAGISREEGLHALLPLIHGTIDNIAQSGTENALTGPIARGDVDTVRQHLQSIQQVLPDKVEFYKLMANSTLTLAKQHKLKDPHKAAALEDLLNE